MQTAIAMPSSRLEKQDPPPENRVGVFWDDTCSRTGAIWSQALETHRETGSTTTTTVSGVVEWLSKDPIGISGGLNQFVAFGNNPVMLRDPWGLCTEQPMTRDDFHAYFRQQYGPILGRLANVYFDIAYRGRQTQRDFMATDMSERNARLLGGTQAFAESVFVGSTIQLTGLAIGHSVPALIPAAAGGGAVLQRGNGVLIAITPHGQVITGNLGTSHAAFGQSAGVVANGQLVSGAYIGTAFNSGGQIVVLNAMTFYGNQTVANPAVQAAVRAAIGAE